MKFLIYEGCKTEALTRFVQSIDMACAEPHSWIHVGLVDIDTIKLPGGRNHVPTHAAKRVRAGILALSFMSDRISDGVAS